MQADGGTAVGQLRTVVEVTDRSDPGSSYRMRILLAEQYGEDPLLAYGRIEDRLWTHGAVELRDDGGRLWHFRLEDLRQFTVSELR